MNAAGGVNLFTFITRHRELFRSLIATSGIEDGPVIAFAEHRSLLHRVFERSEPTGATSRA